MKGALPLLSALIQKEITKLAELEETTLSLHLQQGFALKELIGENQNEFSRIFFT